jgi:hypothetical protein
MVDEQLSRLEMLKARIREESLADRLTRARTMITKMCKERRPPKMSIPVSHEDEDIFISVTLEDALAAIAETR